jgi:hypothetical protein
MVAREGGLPAIVICTGHGPVLSRDDLVGHPSKAPGSKHDLVCSFAGHGIANASPVSLTVVTLLRWSPPESAQPPFDLAPGQGLAAPPPPSQGPPTSLL